MKTIKNLCNHEINCGAVNLIPYELCNLELEAAGGDWVCTYPMQRLP